MEPMESMVEAVLRLCECGPERTGQVYVSLDLLAEPIPPIPTVHQ
jgi:predicted ATP-dependent Lon-type protease